MRKAKLSEDGFFLCTTRYLERSLAWDKDSQKRMFRELRELGFIKTEKRGLPPRRFVYVDLETVEKTLDEKIKSGVFTPQRRYGGKYPPTERGKTGNNKEDTNVSSLKKKRKKGAACHVTRTERSRSAFPRTNQGVSRRLVPLGAVRPGGAEDHPPGTHLTPSDHRLAYQAQQASGLLRLQRLAIEAPL